ncbi:apoptosis-inducing factor 3-like isoform 4-T6 [Pangshura tecta]
MDTEDSITEQVCQESDIQDGELREVEVAGHKVLLVRNKLEFSAVGSKCTHAGASLSKGVLVGNRLRCPWHGACFNIRTGDIEEYPALDCLPCFKVRVEDGKVLITAKKKDLESDRKLKAMSERSRSNENTMLLLGGGAAALVCAETLRQEGFTGRIIMVTKEKHVPYDRTQLSKAMDKTLESIYLRQQDFFEAHDIDVWTDKEMLQNKRVKFYMKDEISELRGENRKVTEAVLASGEKLPADVVVVGIGVTSNSGFLKDTPIAMDRRGAILVDLFMQTNVPRVFAAGDVTSFPGTLFGETAVTIRHWQIAQAHGHIAALNMLKKQKPLHTVPFFWTSLLGKSIRYAGYGKGYTETVVKGNLEQLKFLVFYLKDDYVIAAASLNFDPMVSLVAEVMYSGRRISKAEAQSSDTTWMKQA